MPVQMIELEEVSLVDVSDTTLEATVEVWGGASRRKDQQYTFNTPHYANC